MCLFLILYTVNNFRRNFALKRTENASQIKSKQRT